MHRSERLRVGRGRGLGVRGGRGGKGYGNRYANLIPTPAGGTHEAGLRDGMFDAVKAFAEHHNMMPRGIKLMAEDVWSKHDLLLVGAKCSSRSSTGR